jgi:hypothetical protein
VHKSIVAKCVYSCVCVCVCVCCVFPCVCIAVFVVCVCWPLRYIIYLFIYSLAQAGSMDFDRQEVLRAPVGESRRKKARVSSAVVPDAPDTTASSKFPVVCMLGSRSSSGVSIYGVVVGKSVSRLEANNLDHARQVALNAYEVGVITEVVLGLSWKAMFKETVSMPFTSFRFVSDACELRLNPFNAVLDQKFAIDEEVQSLRQFIQKPSQCRVVMAAPSVVNQQSRLWSDTSMELLISRSACSHLLIDIRVIGPTTSACDIDAFPSLYSDLLQNGYGGAPETVYIFQRPSHV